MSCGNNDPPPPYMIYGTTPGLGFNSCQFYPPSYGYPNPKDAVAFNGMPVPNILMPQCVTLYHDAPPQAVDPTPTPQPSPARLSYMDINGPFWLACCVIWFCNPLFGFVAFFLALCSQSAYYDGDGQSALRLSRVSYIISGVGIAIAIGLFILFMALYYRV